jgi:ADP-ribose diphosphatase
VVFVLPTGERQVFSIRTEPPTVAVLALTARRSVILARQFRPGPLRELYELPGGYLENGEAPSVTAGRELLEETGYVGRLEHVGSVYPDAYSDAVKHCFVAYDCVLGRQPAPDPEEFVAVTIMPIHEFRRVLRTGALTDVDVAYLALDHLDLL